ERLPEAEPLPAADVPRHVARRRDGVDARELFPQRREAEALDSRGVHVGEIEVADLLRIGSRRAIGLLRGRHDELAHLLLRGVVEDDERTVVRPVRRNLRGREPVAADEAIQVVLWPDAAIET